MKNEGSILIFVLLTFTFIITGGLLAVFMASEQIEIANNSITKIQSQYLAESKINKIFYDERYYQEQILPSILKHETVKNSKYTLDKSDIFFDDENWVNGEFYDFEGRRYIELSTTSEFQGSRTHMKAYGTIFNDIFNDKNPALSYNTIIEEDLDIFNLFMNDISYDKINLDNLPNNLTGMGFYDYDRVRMKKTSNIVNSNYQVFALPNVLSNKDEGAVEEVSYGPLKYDSPVFIAVGNSNLNKKTDLLIDDDVYFRGILYVEGNLVIESYFRFLGIIIVKGNIIIDNNLSPKPRIDGVVLYDGDLDLNEWNLRHHIAYLNRYGIYLPNVIEPKLEVYKFMEGK